MMEENAEALMETDVSSTTADVPELQKVTGSHDMETVVVVEKIEDEDISNIDLKSPRSDQRLSQEDDEILNKQKTLHSIERLRDKEGQEQTITENIVSDEIQTQKTYSNSSTKDSSQIPPKHVVSPQKVMLTGLIVVKSPVKSLNPKETAESTNKSTQLENDNSHELAIVQSSAEKSSVKVIQSMEIPETGVSTPAKEQVLIYNAECGDMSKEEEVTIQIELEKETTNDSQVESINVDASEKEHNKSISRELRSLINSAKESKIISECTQLTSKTRKSRTGIETSNTSLNATGEADKIQGIRRNSSNSQKSTSSEKSEMITPKRSMRSQNPEFASKVKQFLNAVTGKVTKNESDGNQEELSDVENEEKGLKRSEEKKDGKEDASPTAAKLMKLSEDMDTSTTKSGKLRSDTHCWRCHWAIEMVGSDKVTVPARCTLCPRTYHYKCLSGTERNKMNPKIDWVCPECMLLLHADTSDTRSLAMKKISLGALCELFKFALKRMMDVNGVEAFSQPVDRAVFPDYDKYVVYPMDLSLMQNNIAEGVYGSTEAFLADVQWILHNSIIFNTMQSKLTASARALLRSCRAEMCEIEACHECYSAAHARKPTWFTDVCTTPHILLWAKLKGFPYWPAKAMSVNNSGHVDVRFFGAHDRAWVPAKDCFLYSEKDPNNFRTKRQDIIDSMQEAEQHIRNISRKYGKFVYPPFKTQFDPTNLEEQLKMMIPSFEGEVKAPIKDKNSPNCLKNKSRSNSKSSVSNNDGDTSDGEDKPMLSKRKMADGAEIATMDEDILVDKDRPLDVESLNIKEKGTTRKRRRSELDEAVITVIENSNVGKRKKIENEPKTKASTSEVQEPTCGNDLAKENGNLHLHTTSDKEETRVPKRTDNSQKDTDTSSATVVSGETPQKVSPIKLVFVNKSNKDSHKSNKDTAKSKEGAKSDTSKDKTDRSSNKDRFQTQESKSKRRNSKSNKSLNKSSSERKGDHFDTNQNKAKIKETDKVIDLDKSITDKNTSTPKTNAKKPTSKELFDDDTSLAIIAREVAKTHVISNNEPGLPTISSVVSLNTSENIKSCASKNAPATNSNDVVVEVSPESSVFTPTSTSNPQNMKEAVNNLKKIRSDTDKSKVGRVGVKAFARIAPAPAKDVVEVEIKSEPIDLDDPERHSEKMDLMKAFKLRPVNPAGPLREVRINKVISGPATPAQKKTVTKSNDARPVAKKTFPQPMKKPDEGRSELNGKNSMVYIPIQPPMTQAPMRPIRPISNANTTPTTIPRLQAPIIHTNTMVKSVTPSSTSSSFSTPPSTSSPTVASNSLAVVSSTSLQTVPTVGPATVHTVPLITSVNGQWTFSLQPVMSVGGVDGSMSPPMMNGLPERSSILPANALPMTAVSAVNPTALITTQAPALQNIPNVTTAIPPNRPAMDGSLPGELPRLMQRPVLLSPLDSHTPIGLVPPPSAAGPLTTKLNQNAVKLADFFRNLLVDSLEKLDEPSSQLATLRLQIEQARWRHQQEIKELKHTHELQISEMRSSFEKEKSRAISDVRRSAQMELETAVNHAKSKQWCANCNQEAQFYCCWNTSYCDYPCQRAHWNQHFSVCTQQRAQNDGSANDGSSNPPESRLQQAPPENLQKNTSLPNMSANKTVTTTASVRSPSQKSSIIVSMVEDTNGNQTMKCLGTYSKMSAPPPHPLPAQHSHSLLINQQVINNEEGSAKKVVTSGGYLIVGGNQPPMASRRAPTMQMPYFT